MPFSSSALMITSAVTPPPRILPTATPNGAVPDSRPRAAEGREAGQLVPAVPRLATGEPMLAGRTSQLMPSSRPALRDGLDEPHLEHHLLRLRHLHRVDDLRAELLRDGDGLVDRDGVGRGARQHDPAVDGRHPEAGTWKPARSSLASTEVSKVTSTSNTPTSFLPSP